MTMNRRQWLRLSASAALTSLVPPLVSACATPAGSGTRRADRSRVALILPLSGPSADVGRSMERAAALTQAADERDSGFLVLDSGGPSGARGAAERAVIDGSALIVGPLFGRDVPDVVAVAAGRPVLTFSNDTGLVGSGAFLLGVTASQGVSAILNYAQGRGVRRLAVIAGTDVWSSQSLAAARRVSGLVGLDLFELAATGTVTTEQLTVASGGRLPDAVLFTRSGSEAAASVARVTEMGVQVLGASRWADETGTFLGAAAGSWIAAPDPAAFGGFAEAFEATHRSDPGLLDGLAFDAATIARRLLAAGRLSRDGLLAPDGFQGSLGAVRFAADGRCTRELAIQVIERQGRRVVAHVAGE